MSTIILRLSLATMDVPRRCLHQSDPSVLTGRTAPRDARKCHMSTSTGRVPFSYNLPPARRVSRRAVGPRPHKQDTLVSRWGSCYKKGFSKHETESPKCEVLPLENNVFGMDTIRFFHILFLLPLIQRRNFLLFILT